MPFLSVRSLRKRAGLWRQNLRLLWNCISLLGNCDGAFYSNLWVFSVIFCRDFTLSSYLKSTKTLLNVRPNESGFFPLFVLFCFVLLAVIKNSYCMVTLGKVRRKPSGSDGETGVAGTPGKFIWQHIYVNSRLFCVLLLYICYWNIKS